MSDDEVLPCAEKLAFDTQKQADAASVLAKWEHGANLKSYQCGHCGLWHLASSHIQN